MKRRAIYGLIGLALIAGCGGGVDDGGSEEKTNARDPDLQATVESQISGETEAVVGQDRTDAEIGFAVETSECKAVSDSKLTCVVKGETLKGDFRWEWEATVSDTGRFVATPTVRDIPGGSILTR